MGDNMINENSFYVAILILLELTLQYGKIKELQSCLYGRNPYFIGINSAIELYDDEILRMELSQSLFYWN